MLGKTHKYVGACTSIIVAEHLIGNNLNTENLIYGGLMVSSGIVASLLLDIDKKGTKISNKLPSFVSTICSKLFGHRGATHAPFIWVLICLSLFYLNESLNDIIRAIFIGIFTCFSIYKLIRYIFRMLYNQVKIRKAKEKALAIALLLSLLISGSFFYIGNNMLYISYLFIVIGIFVGAMSHIILDSFNPMGTPWLYPFTKRKYRILKLSEKYGFMFSVLATIGVIINTIYMYFL